MPNLLNIVQAMLILCLSLTLLGCGSLQEPTTETEPVAALDDSEPAPQPSPAAETPSPAAELPVEIQAAPTATPALPTELEEAAAPAPVPTIEPTVVPLSAASVQPPPGSEEILKKVLADLAERVSIQQVGEVTLTAVEPVDWPDASLGCPQEGFMYAQVVTPGYRMLFDAGAQQFEYHTDQSQNFVLCEQ